MMQRAATALAISLSLLGLSTRLTAQSAPNSNPILQRIWTLGMDSSQTYPLAQVLLDSIGPRLTGTPQQDAAVNWVLSRYASWGIPAHKEQYGTAPGWSRGYTHVDLIAPRMRTLEATMLAWSPGTGGKDVEAELILPPTSSADLAGWFQQAKGKYVLSTAPEPTCRPEDDWQHWAKPGSRPGRAGSASQERVSIDLAQLDTAEIAGVLAGRWAGGWGSEKITATKAKRVPVIRLSCEDYGLVYRLAEHQQKPRVRVNATSKAQGDVPVFNAVAEIKGTEKSDEYVMLSAHLDSWDGASGATDNGTGTIVMLEAMRILKAVYPKPKRTILVGHWNGEEQGENGSGAFVKAHPEIVQNLHVLFNQDDGTGRIATVLGEGFAAAKEYFTRWLAQLPTEFTQDLKLDFPGSGGNDSSDNDVFVKAGAPGFFLSSLPWNYEHYTWHTNRDTFDKISFDDLKSTATFIAMLTYLASEDSTKMPRN